MQKKIQLVANEWAELAGMGRNFVLLSTGAAPSVDLEFLRDNWPIGEVSQVERGFALSVQGRLDKVRIRAAVTTVASCFLSDEAASVSFPDSQSVEATIVGPLPLPISMDRGTPGNPIHAVGITYSDAPATSIVDRAPVACSGTIAALLPASTARKRARFCNLGPNPVTLGAAGHTWARRCLVLEVGDVWIEDSAANLAWFGITDAGGSASVTVQEVIA